MSYIVFHTGLNFLSFLPFTLQYYTASPTLMYSLAMFIVYLYDYHLQCWSLICSIFVVRMKQTASLTSKQNGERSPLKNIHVAIYKLQAIIKNMRKPTSVDPLEVKGLWEIGHILSLPHSIFIQKFFSYIYEVFLTRGFWVPVNQGNFANKEKTTETSFTDDSVFSIIDTIL